ncbi:hypothetical protein AK33_04365 [Mannheimia granulomatis]|uniref:Toxin CdiA n=1 Tax=Mannheimia granulomatis TaxID=85402 RepID=A0A011NDZ8_9PAST|nr:hypothetical protein AK33_04365 [Mannheimia granulomatis]
MDYQKQLSRPNKLKNIGTGRIYGDHITLGADNILNQDKNGISATIAARKHLNLAAREIQNETQTYDPVKKGGSFIYSAGSINIGGKLDSQDTVIGNTEHLKNLSSIIEAGGDIYLDVNKINNKNVHYRSELETIHAEKVKEHFILPRHRDERGGEDVFNNGHLETIDTKNLTKGYYRKTWSYWQKYNQDTLPVITDINQITDKTMLAKPYALKCEDQNSVDCTVLPAGDYKKDSPVWTKFAIPAPEVDQPEMTPEIVRAMNEEDLATRHLSEEELDKLTKEQEKGIAPVVPAKPTKPTQGATESAEAYQKRLAEYQTKLKAYEEAESAYKRYVLLKPFIDWEAKYGSRVQDLAKAIEEHNKKIGGQEYAHFWNLWIDERVVKENVTKASLPAQILAGGDINYKSDTFTNDKSWVIAGRKLNQLGTGKIANLDDENAVHQDWELGTRKFSYTVWRGGTKNRHSRYDGNEGPLARLKEVHKDMNIFVELENTSPATYKDYVNTKLVNQVKEESNNVNITNRDDLNYSTLNALGTEQVVKELGTQKVPSIDTNKAFEIHSVTVDTRLPNQSIYRINPNADSHILIETDPDFTDKKQWLSSDYMFNALRYEHNNVQKRLGDGFYEQSLVREQINQLKGRYYLDNYSDFDSQYRSLMDAGVTFAQKFNLRPGISLTPSQVAQLTSDIVWLESQQITLPNGEKVSALVPKVYALARKGDINGKGSLISADTLKLNSSEIINEGTMAGRKLVQLSTERMRNSGKLSGGVVSGKVTNDLDNIGGVIEADRAVLFEIGGNFNHRSTTQTTDINLDGFKRTETNLDRKGLLHVKGENGTLHINANNINLGGADIINDGQGSTYLSAKNQLNLTALQVGFDEKMGGGNHYRNESVNDVVVSRIKGNGNVTLFAKDIYSEGANIEAKARLTAFAENDIVLGSATRSSDYEEYHHTKSGGAFGRSKKTSLDTDQQVIKVGTKLGGGEIIVSAGHDVKAHNLQAIADKDLVIQGGNNVTIGSDVNRFRTTHFEEKSKSGVFSGGGIGITFGKKSEKHEHETEGWQGSEARSTLGSLSGNITVSAGHHAHLAGVDAIASKELGKQILVEGKSTYIGASEDTLSSKERHEQKQSGLTIAFSSAVTDGVMAAKQALDRSGQVNDERLGALLKVKSANEAYDAVQKVKKVIDALKSNGDTAEKLANSDAKISVSIGSSQSVSTSHTQQTTHKGSELDAGKVIVRATDGDNTIKGSKINATRTELEGNNVNLLGTTNSQTNRSDNKSSSWSVGAFIGKSQESSGLGVEGAANVGKGYANSDSKVQNLTEINSDSLSIKTKETTTLKGAVANINHLALETKNLHIESVQDTEKYDSKQSQVSGSGSLALGANGLNGGASAQFSQNKAKVDYAQVNQQSGFNIQKSSNINVTENTHLKGGIINAEGDKANHQMTTGTLTMEAIENHSDVKVSSVSVGVSSDMSKMATMAVGAALSALGNMRESERSQTKAAISSNINLSITDSDKQKALTGKTAEETLQSLNRDTANANQAVEKADLNAIQERQEATQIVAEIGAKRVGDFAQYMGWEDGSPQKVALHGLVGYLAAKVGDGNTAASTLSAMGSEYINMEIANYLQENTALTADERNAIQQATAAGLGALIGATLGGNSNEVTQSAQMALRTEKLNRQLHPDEKQRIKDLANGDKEKEARLTAAACALVHCSAQIPSDDPEYAEVYAQAKALEDLGNQAEFASERELLSRQLADYDISDGVSGYRKKLFQYDKYVNRGIDSLNQTDTKYGVTTRVIGAVQTAGGATIATGSTLGTIGACTGTVGSGCIVAVPIGAIGAAYGSDLAASGIKAVYTGKYHSPIGSQAFADLTGISQDTADLIYGAPSAVFGVKPIATGVAKVGQAAVKEAVEFGNATKYVVGELGKDVRATSNYINDVTTRVGVNTQNSQALTNINNAIPKEYKVAFGINAITGGAVESLYYIDGSKNITKDNLAGSIIKVGTNATYDSLVHKLNPFYGVTADTVKGILIDDKSITNSINGSLQSSGVSTFIEGGADRLHAPSNMGRFISSFGNKYIEYKEERDSKREGK